METVRVKPHLQIDAADAPLPLAQLDGDQPPGGDLTDQLALAHLHLRRSLLQRQQLVAPAILHLDEPQLELSDLLIRAR